MKLYCRIALTILLLAGMFSCGNRDHIPRDVIGWEKMSKILLDMQEAEVFSDSYMDTSYRPENREERLKYLYAEILSIHKISREKFMSSYKFYESHPDLLKKIYAQMQTDIDRKKNYADSLAAASEKLRLSLQQRQKLIEKWYNYCLPYQRVADSISAGPYRIFRPAVTFPEINNNTRQQLRRLKPL